MQACTGRCFEHATLMPGVSLIVALLALSQVKMGYKEGEYSSAVPTADCIV